MVEGTPGSGKTRWRTSFRSRVSGGAGEASTSHCRRTERELRNAARSHGWSLDQVTILEVTPLEADPAKQQSLIHPAEVGSTKPSA
jgi:circadian clock protein KaiC